MKKEKHLPPAAAQGDWLIEQLRDPALSVAYLNAALAEGDQAARDGVAAMARDTGMNRVALSRALSESGNPELRSLTKILDASGMQLVVVKKEGMRRRAAKKRPRSAHRDARKRTRRPDSALSTT